MPKYEYAVFISRENEPHREHLTEQAAHEWIQEWLDDGGKPGIFHIMRRKIGEWEVPEGK